MQEPKTGIARLFDRLIADQVVKNDAALSRALQLAPPQISKVRLGRMACGSAMILALHETFDIPVAEIRRYIAGGLA